MSSAQYTTSSYAKFIIPLQGGFDGGSPSKNICIGQNIVAGNLMGFNLAAAQSSNQYIRAIKCIENPDQIDINVLCMPGVLAYTHTTVSQYAMTAMQDRGDCFVLFDLCKKGVPPSSVLTYVDDIDNNYAATYYPWCKIRDQVNDKFV